MTNSGQARISTAGVGLACLGCAGVVIALFLPLYEELPGVQLVEQNSLIQGRLGQAALYGFFVLASAACIWAYCGSQEWFFDFIALLALGFFAVNFFFWPLTTLFLHPSYWRLHEVEALDNTKEVNPDIALYVVSLSGVVMVLGAFLMFIQRARWNKEGGYARAKAAGPNAQVQTQSDLGTEPTEPALAMDAVQPEVAQPDPTSDGRAQKRCPDCAEDVKREAVVCRYCGHNFSE
jgi:hypothetical protein